MGHRGIALIIQELESDGKQRHQRAEDLAESAIGEPALQPGADHAREKNIHHRVHR